MIVMVKIKFKFSFVVFMVNDELELFEDFD